MHSMRTSVAVALVCASAAIAAEPPVAEFSNGRIRASVYLPDPENGFYRGTRFDWSGVVRSLDANGHRYYGPWFSRRSDTVRDFVYDGTDIVAGPCSSTMGPADEFRPLGYDAAKPGATFVKIGVGALTRPDDKPYDAWRLYAIANHGKWTVKRKKDSLELRQVLRDEASGYAYEYRKTLRLVPGKDEMELVHSLKNLGRNAIGTQVYNHNFLLVDGKGPRQGTTISLPFAIGTARQPNPDLAEVRGNQVVYRKMLEAKETVSVPIEGFGGAASDHEIRIESSDWKAGVSVRGDRPLARIALWSIRSNVSIEPFVAVSVEPGKEFRWTATYRYYALP